MVLAIDAVCNLWTKEINRTRPKVLDDQVRHFWQSYAKIDRQLYEGETVEGILRRMDRAGIEKGFLIAPALGIWNVPYEKIAQAVGKYPDRFHGLAGSNAGAPDRDPNPSPSCDAPGRWRRCQGRSPATRSLGAWSTRAPAPSRAAIDRIARSAALE